jgi:hypothetical protein
MTPDTNRLALALTRSAPDLAQTKPVLKSGLAETIRANHKEDADRLYTRYGVDLGLNKCGVPLEFLDRASYCVGDIVNSVDREIVYQLLLKVLSDELERPKRILLFQLAVMVYHNIPSVLRPVRLHAWLKKRLRLD